MSLDLLLRFIPADVSPEERHVLLDAAGLRTRGRPIAACSPPTQGAADAARALAPIDAPPSVAAGQDDRRRGAGPYRQRLAATRAALRSTSRDVVAQLPQALKWRRVFDRRERSTLRAALSVASSVAGHDGELAAQRRFRIAED